MNGQGGVNCLSLLELTFIDMCDSYGKDETLLPLNNGSHYQEITYSQLVFITFF